MWLLSTETQPTKGEANINFRTENLKFTKNDLKSLANRLGGKGVNKLGR